jgi:hypothetical protein
VYTEVEDIENEKIKAKSVQIMQNIRVFSGFPDIKPEQLLIQEVEPEQNMDEDFL